MVLQHQLVQSYIKLLILTYIYIKYDHTFSGYILITNKNYTN